jgi:hypothetical protein
VALKSFTAFGLKALAWTPLMFFAWFGLAKTITALVVFLAGYLISFLDPDIVVSFLRSGLEIHTTIRLPEGSPHAYGKIVVDAMQFGYGLPLYAALTLVPPTSGWVLLLRLLTGFLAVVAIQVWAVVFSFLDIVHIQMAQQIPQFQVSNLLLESTIIAASKLGVFILPPLVPLLLWAGLHREFLATLLAREQPDAG